MHLAESSDGGSGRRFARLAWPAVFLALLLCGAAWAVAAPYNAPPDEAEHVARAVGVARGEVFSRATTAGMGTGAYQTVPESLIRPVCFQMQSHRTAACQPEPGGDATLTEVVTRAGRYNPVYYAVVGWPLRFWPDWTGVLLARLLTAAMVAGLLTGALHSALKWTAHGGMLAGVLVATTPLLFHLAGSVNPAGVEIAAGIALFAAGIPLLLNRPARLDPVLMRRVGVAAVTLATLRSLGPLWLALALGVLLLPTSRALVRELWRSVRARVWAVVVAAGVVAGAAWTVGMHAATLITMGVDVTFGQAVKHEAISRWPAYVEQMVGRMSYDDTPLPSLSYLAWYAAVGSLLFTALAFARWVDRWRLLAIAAATFAVPTLSDAVSVQRFGYASQGRYMLPLAVGLPLLAAYLLSTRGDVPLGARRIGSLTRTLAVTLLPIHLVALCTAMVRWQRGLPQNSAFTPLNPLRGAWQPVLGPEVPLLAMVAGIALLLVCCWRATRARTDDAVSTAPLARDEREPVPTGA
ncbi:DUF2142 domain-containing protein [Planosporangium mesophilum]|uniref:DUF2142 domain-containing protein n=1 Tax=Planosporangium mesophilum TaxID=689768 RepID=A0A8J3TIL0_9ACTN|nr:DUF2142 domain-containing protein [Planosporangium mesophilum]NJC86843.1 DUF2142 domain-containing protein [Planosporangium mesophilum]GII26356.1 hypothetical protein Pme01_59530 [Planosporangium mesophilum]